MHLMHKKAMGRQAIQFNKPSTRVLRRGIYEDFIMQRYF